MVLLRFAVSVLMLMRAARLFVCRPAWDHGSAARLSPLSTVDIAVDLGVDFE